MLIEWFSDRNNVTFMIAIVGFAISIYNFISSAIQSSTRIKVDVAHVFRSENSKQCVDIVNLKIVNISKNPVVLSRLTVENKSHSGSFGTYRRQIYKVTHRTGGVITSQNEWHSDQLPIKIEGNGCVNLVLVTDVEIAAFAKGQKNTIKLHTGKKTIKHKFTLTDFSQTELLVGCKEPS